MSLNLRENKMDKFDKKGKRGSFLGMGKKPKKLNPAPKKQQISPVSPKKNLKTAQKKEMLHRAPEMKQNESVQAKSEKWVRKAPKKPLSEDALNYQENYEYKREYSRYLQQNKENVVVSWRGPEFEHYPKDKKWYTGALLILALIIFYAVIKGGIIMAITFALIGLVGYLILSQSQKVIDFAVTYDGILVGDEIYDFDDIKSFWIFYEPPHTRVISLHMNGYFRPYLHIPLHQVDPVDVHKALVEFIPEEKQEQNIVDIMERLLRM